MWVEGVEKPVTFSFVYSIEAPHIELVQQIPGTPWIPAGKTATHHLGYFCDDLVATGAKLAENGFRCESHAVIDSAMSVFAFYVDSDGLRVELVDRAVFRARRRGGTPDAGRFGSARRRCRPPEGPPSAESGPADSRWPPTRRSSP